VDVTLLRWPDEDARRARLSQVGGARLLLVPDGQEPPPVLDCLEDWIRVPAAETEVRARVDALTVRSSAHEAPAPVLDDHGVLRARGAWVALPPLEARLTQALLDRIGAVTSRDLLVHAGWPEGSPGRNALDVHVLRLRRRLRPLGLAIRTVRSRGYLLEAAAGS
jgi:DNA-binding response OmpR family regulator